ncbi:MAG: GlsB/YeaQ/YmgE family stress response membrane protein [Clostridiales bacterium]|nr:GlsB/YeaQ/YmgE family stress response membrane protein [Clostridiales bacterium]MCC8099003.1 GlsB/YeaQ/YmgE family stress response membrane protein [Clostridiales bacterium]
MFSILSTLILGLLAGYLACRIMGQGSSMVMNLIVGVVGAAIGSFLFSLIGIYAYSWIGQLLVAIIGACVLLWLVNYISSHRH